MDVKLKKGERYTRWAFLTDDAIGIGPNSINLRKQALHFPKGVVDITFNIDKNLIVMVDGTGKEDSVKAGDYSERIYYLRLRKYFPESKFYASEWKDNKLFIFLDREIKSPYLKKKVATSVPEASVAPVVAEQALVELAEDNL